MHNVISPPCYYKLTMLSRDNFTKELNGHFPIIPCKFHGTKIWDPQYDCIISKSKL